MGLISPITIVYGRPFHRIPLWLIFITIITIVNGVYEPIYNYIIYMVYGKYINNESQQTSLGGHNRENHPA
jgi:hypothetical protein